MSVTFRRHPVGPQRRGEGGVTALEVLLSIAVVSLIMVPLSGAFRTGISTTTNVADRIRRTDDRQRIATYWTRDVQSVDLNGVYDRTAHGSTAATCGPQNVSGETLLVSFSWAIPAVTGGPVQTASWVITGSGLATRLERRFCSGGTLVTTDTVASDFMGTRASGLRALHATAAKGWTATPDGSATLTAGNLCSATDCTIVVDPSTADSYQLSVARRLAPLAVPSASTPVVGKLYAVSALSSTAVWAVGENCALVFYTSGVTAKKVASPAGCTADLYGVAAVSTTAAYAVGANGTFLRCYSACDQITAKWVKLTAPGASTSLTIRAVAVSTNTVGAISSDSSSKLIAVGDSNLMIACSANCFATAANDAAAATAGTWTTQSLSLGASTPATANLTSVSIANNTNANSSPYGYITVGGLDSANKGRLLRCGGSCTSAASWVLETQYDSTATSALVGTTFNTVAIAGGSNPYTVISGSNGKIWYSVGLPLITGGRTIKLLDIKDLPAGRYLVAASAQGNTTNMGSSMVDNMGGLSTCEGTFDACNVTNSSFAYRYDPDPTGLSRYTSVTKALGSKKFSFLVGQNGLSMVQSNTGSSWSSPVRTAITIFN